MVPREDADEDGWLTEDAGPPMPSRAPNPNRSRRNGTATDVVLDDEPVDAPQPANQALAAMAADRALRFGRAHASILGVIVMVAVVFTGSRVMAARGHDVEPVAVTTAAPQSSDPTAMAPSASPLSPSSSPTLLLVHVLGAVNAPGVVSVMTGARVVDAIAAAGGLRADADPAELNMAALVFDGAQIVIGTITQPRGEMRTDAGSPQVPGEMSGAGTTPTLNLNTATVQQLESLPGVGPVTAARIVAWREANGGFTRVEELQEVDGIGPKTYASLAPLVHV